jgi:hypothetical protein
MAQRQLQFKPEADVSPCPTCGNTSRFAIVAERAAEDCCDVYLRCVCGECPDSEHAIEDVWGDTSPAMAACAIQPWNEWCQEVADGKKQTQAQMVANR